jgi:two-component system OmpR family sensor kinase
MLGIVLTLVVGFSATRLVDRRERDLVEYSSLLREQNRELDLFAGRVAHDLRGPLTVMNLAAARLKQHSVDQEAASGLIRKGVSRMETLIRDLLTLSQVDEERRGAVCDPASAMASLREDVAARVREAGGTLRVAVAPARLHGSEGLLVQALANLLDNAVKYARPDVPLVVEVGGERRQGAYELRVRDNGLGMSPEEAAQVFEPFYRAMRAPATTGTGLGLSIVKRVAEASGGTVHVESALGAGCSFVMRLPLAEGDAGRG